MEVKRLNKLWTNCKIDNSKLDGELKGLKVEHEKLKLNHKTLNEKFMDLETQIKRSNKEYKNLKRGNDVIVDIADSRREVLEGQQSEHDKLFSRFEVWENKVFLNVGMHFKDKKIGPFSRFVEPKAELEKHK
eukprot:UN02204